MANVLRRIMVVFLGAAALSLLSGCTDWKKQYDGLTVEHQNLLGRYELCMDSLDDTATEKVQLSQALISAQQELAELQRQMEDHQLIGQRPLLLTLSDLHHLSRPSLQWVLQPWL